MFDLLWLYQPECRDIRLVGGKVAHLSALAAAHQIPPGFCLTTHAFSQWTSHGVNNGALPSALREQVIAAYDTVAEQSGVADPLVAVRSSAVDEGLFAWQFSCSENSAPQRTRRSQRKA